MKHADPRKPTLQLQDHWSALHYQFSIEELDPDHPMEQGLSISQGSVDGKIDFLTFDAVDALHLLIWLQEHQFRLLECAMDSLHRKLDQPRDRIAKQLEELVDHYRRDEKQ